ncbi:hypothetical protein BDV96DRAFT_651819 [Lophiotrema nucula]|uniref:Clr5 domain-containing protein n=1 Tax=Lophiotrema nucula TaxID=690887 RepID=A0A6A5YQ64_9PLEO|nr:hypothetical protein BDV96DRAFT_651819 [Lophiotrema nucula]
MNASPLDFGFNDLLSGNFDDPTHSLPLDETLSHESSWTDLLFNGGVGNGWDFQFPDIIPLTVATDVESRVESRKATENLTQTSADNAEILAPSHGDPHTSMTPPRRTRKRKTGGPAQDGHAPDQDDGGAKGRRKKNTTLRDYDWEPNKLRIIELRVTQGHTLEEVQEIMFRERGFYATRKQYMDRLKRWHLKKNSRAPERKAIVRKHRERTSNNSKRALNFWIRGVKISDAKIKRWTNDESSSKKDSECLSPAPSTPSAISCRTVSNHGSPSSTPIIPAAAPIRSSHNDRYSTSQYSLDRHVRLAHSLPSFPWRTLPARTMDPLNAFLVHNEEVSKASFAKLFTTLHIGGGDKLCEALAQEMNALLSTDSGIMASLSLLQFPRASVGPYILGTDPGWRGPLHNTIGSTTYWEWVYDAGDLDILFSVSRTVSQNLQSMTRLVARFEMVSVELVRSWHASFHFFLDRDEVDTSRTWRALHRFHWNDGPDRPSYRAARDNDVDSLGELFSSQQATPNDRCNELMSLIQVATLMGAYQATTFLLEQGATRGLHDIFWTTWIGFFERQLSGMEQYALSAADDITRCKAISQLAFKHGATIEYCPNYDIDVGNLLHLPCAYHNIGKQLLDDIVHYFLLIGCDIEYHNAKGLTPLLRAAYTKQYKLTDYLSVLIEYGANIFATDSRGRGALHIVVLGSYAVEKKDEDRTSPCKFSTIDEVLEELQRRLVVLMMAGCSPSAIDQHGCTAEDLIQDDSMRIVWNSAIEQASRSRIRSTPGLE